jgi:hypothetical protein
MGDVIEFREDDREIRKLVVAIGDLTHLISKTQVLLFAHTRAPGSESVVSSERALPDERPNS